MKLHKLPNGAWIDPAKVTAIVPHVGEFQRPQVRAHLHGGEPGRHMQIVLFETAEAALTMADELAEIVNQAPQP